MYFKPLSFLMDIYDHVRVKSIQRNQAAFCPDTGELYIGDGTTRTDALVPVNHDPRIRITDPDTDDVLFYNPETGKFENSASLTTVNADNKITCPDGTNCTGKILISNDSAGKKAVVTPFFVDRLNRVDFRGNRIMNARIDGGDVDLV
jgi:hypothetical protein